MSNQASMFARLKTSCDSDLALDAIGVVILCGLFVFWDLSRAVYVITALAALPLLIRGRPSMPRDHLFYSVPIFVLFGVYLLILVYHGLPKQGLNVLFSRYFLLLLAVPLVGLYFTRSSASVFLWQKFLLATLLLGTLGLVDIIQHDKPRADGDDNAVVFGFVAMAVTSIVIATQRDLRRLPHGNWVFFSALAMGLIAVLLSGSRGSWIAAVAVSFIALLFYLDRFSIGKRLLAALLVIVLLGGSVLAIPQVQFRIDHLVRMATPYFNGEQQQRYTSLSFRLQTWKVSWEIARENPLVGVGPGYYRKALKQYVQQNPEYEGLQIMKHAHNQYLQTFASAGIVGLVALLGLIVSHGWLFAKHLSRRYPEQIRSLALAGLLLVVSYSLMSLTAVPFERKKLLLLYGFSSAALWGGLLARLGQLDQHIAKQGAASAS